MSDRIPSPRPCAAFAALCLCLALGSPAAPAAGAGVTVITHGFNGNVTDWIIPMAQRVPAHPLFPFGDFSCYQISITQSGPGQYAATAVFLGGTAPTLTASGEILVKLDWSALAGAFQASTTTIANAAASALLSTSLIPALGGRALAEFPLHLAGHSRGGSVVTEMARFLGAQGAWVDHVTTLDPRPVGAFGDAAVTTWANVLYADNFWQTLGDGLFVPNGQSVFGAYNRKLLTLGGGYSSSHSDVHLWYHGTIELTTPATDTQATVTPAERGSWWTGAESAGATAGFHYSLLGGGDRLSNLEPAGAGNGRIVDGYNRQWDLGAGLAANRTALPANAGLWPNVVLCSFATPGPVPAGNSFELALYQQSGAGASGVIDTRILLDPDFNPWNGNEIEVRQQSLPKTGPSVVGFSASPVAVDPAAVAPGSYAVCARIVDGARTRYRYAPGLLAVAPSLLPPSIDPDSLGIDAGLLRFDVRAFPGQHVAVVASTDLADWVTAATHTFTTPEPWVFTDADTASFPRRYYKAKLVAP